MKKPKSSKLQVINGYKFDKRIFRLTIFLLLAYFFIAWGTGGFFNPLNPPKYVYCPEDSRNWCDNPLFTGYWDISPTLEVSDNVSSMQYIPPGYTYGKKPNFLYSQHLNIIFALIVMAFLFNHLKHNKGEPK